MKPSKFKTEKPNPPPDELLFNSAIKLPQIPKSLEFKSHCFQTDEFQDEIILNDEKDKLIRLFSSGWK